jgi:hypothetical protein
MNQNYVKNIDGFYSCNVCAYVTQRKTNLTKHFSTLKHKKLEMSQKCYKSSNFGSKVAILGPLHKLCCKICDYTAKSVTEFKLHVLSDFHIKKIATFWDITDYSCDSCNFYTKNKSKFIRHIKTNRHIQNEIDTIVLKMKTSENDTETHNIHRTSNVYICETCNKEYRYKSCYDKHMKSHTVTLTQHSNEYDNVKNVIIDILSNDKQVQDIKKGTKSTIINNYNQYNTYIDYLNVECKDAINLTDFIKQLEITIQDLLYLKDNGFTASVKQLMLDKFIKMEQTKRPIHCVNKRKKTMYIKDKNSWEQDEEYKQIKNSIHRIHNKEMEFLTKHIDKTGFDNEDIVQQNNDFIISLTKANKTNTTNEIIKNISKHMELKQI